IALFPRRAIAPTFEQRQQHLLRTSIPMLRCHVPEDWRADQTFLSLPHVVFGLRLDQWLLYEPQRLAARDLVGYLLDQSVSHILEHDRLQCERGRPGGCLRGFDQRAPPKRLDCLHDSPTVGPWAQLGNQFADVHWLAFNGQDSQHFLLDHRAALDLLGQQPADATKDCAEARLVEERPNVATEDLTDALADQLQ